MRGGMYLASVRHHFTRAVFLSDEGSTSVRLLEVLLPVVVLLHFCNFCILLVPVMYTRYVRCSCKENRSRDVTVPTGRLFGVPKLHVCVNNLPSADSLDESPHTYVPTSNTHLLENGKAQQQVVFISYVLETRVINRKQLATRSQTGGLLFCP